MKRFLFWIPRNKETLFLWLFGFVKIPMIFYLRPQVMEVNDKRAVMCIPLSRRSKNHLNVMYFAALSLGADCILILFAKKFIEKRKNEKIHFLFKNFKADFLKRAEGDVHFIFEEGEAVEKLLEKCSKSMQREELVIHSHAIVPEKLGNEPVARFELTISVKRYA